MCNRLQVQYISTVTEPSFKGKMANIKTHDSELRGQQEAGHT